MADAQRTIDIVFNGVDKTSAAVQSSIKNVNSFSGSLESATQPFANAASAAVKYEAAILAAGAAVTAFSVIAAGDFQSAAIDLQKVLSDTDSIEQYKELALELSSAYGVAADDVLSSIADFKQAGFDAEEAGLLTKSALDLVIAGNIEAEQASLGLVAAIKGFGAEASTSTTIVDLLNSVSNEYGATVEQLLEGFSTLSPVARTAGLSLQETVGILTPGIEVFQSGAEVANSLRTALLRLQDDSRPVQDALQSLGVAQNDANGNLREGRDIFFDVAEALQSTESSQQTYLASQLVGIQRTSQFLSVVNGLDTALRISGEGFQFAGSAAAEVEAQFAGFESSVNRLQVNFKNLGVAIGAPLLEEFGNVNNALSNVFQTLGESFGAGELQEITSFISSELETLAEALLGIGAALPDALSKADISGFTDGLEEIRKAVTGIFGDLDLSEADDLAKAIEFIANSFESLSDFSAGVIDSFGPVLQALGDLASEAESGGDAMFELGRSFGITSQVNLAAGAVSNITGVLGDLALVVVGARVLGGGVAAGGLVGGLTALGGALAPLIAVGGALAGIVAPIQALADLSRGGNGDNFINSLPSLFGGQDFSTMILDQFFPSSEEIDRRAKNIGDVYADIQSGLLGLNDAAGRDDYVTRLAEINVETIKVGESTEDTFDQINNAISVWDDLGDQAKTATGAMTDFSVETLQASEASKKIGADGANLTGYFSVVSSGASSSADSLDKLADASADLRAELAIAAVEASGAIEVARIEADTARGVAAFESLAQSITSSSDALDTLYGALADENIRKFDKIDIRDNIEDEFQARLRNFELQEELTEAEIRVANARARSFERGDALITINGDGLQPHLEAFMFEILESIQVRVNQDGYNLLLGA